MRIYKKKYNLYARRNDSDHWTIWLNTDSVDVCNHHIEAIKSYGWQWEVR